MLKYPPPGNKHFEKDVRSRPIGPDLPDGIYVYVQDEAGVVWVIPDEQKHQHVTILGGTIPVQYAGDMEKADGCVRSITNCSGTFQYEDRAGLLSVAQSVRNAGLRIDPQAVRFFAWSEAATVEILE